MPFKNTTESTNKNIKVLPKRTTKNAQKLTILPTLQNKVYFSEGDVSGQQVIKKEIGTKPTFFGNKLKKILPTINAVCLSRVLKTKSLFLFLQSYKYKFNCEVKKLPECLHAKFSFLNTAYEDDEEENVDFQQFITKKSGFDSLNLSENSDTDELFEFKKRRNTYDVFIFGYGIIVFWGTTKEQEKFILEIIDEFLVEKLDESHIENEILYFYYTKKQSSKIQNDILSLKKSSDFMPKLAISHAMAQSAKLSNYENLVGASINSTQSIPRSLGRHGKVMLPRSDIVKRMGKLYLVKTEINLISNVLDTPEVFWSKPSSEPLYRTIRNYLEITQRATLLNKRVNVIQDLLSVLREEAINTNDEYLVWIIIFLLAIDVTVLASSIAVQILNYNVYK